MSIDDLQKWYVSLFGIEPTEVGELSRMEKRLGVHFPQDFEEISKFYKGGIIGGISHHAIATGRPGASVTEETERLRQAVGLPHDFVVLAEPSESLIVMNTSATSGSPVVIWCDASDVYRLGTLEELRKPDTWPSYAEFFSYLLGAEAEDRL